MPDSVLPQTPFIYSPSPILLVILLLPQRLVCLPQFTWGGQMELNGGPDRCGCSLPREGGAAAAAATATDPPPPSASQEGGTFLHKPSFVRQLASAVGNSTGAFHVCWVRVSYSLEASVFVAGSSCVG